MKLNVLLVFLLVFSFVSSSQNIIKKYSNQVGDIEFDKEIDSEYFSICDSTKIYQYYNFGKGFQYKGEKSEILRVFKEKFKPNIEKYRKESGYITIRFIVNCEGVAGYFRTQEMGLDYQPKIFEKEVLRQLLTITKSLDGWYSIKSQYGSYSYYQYLTFKLIDSKIVEILP